MAITSVWIRLYIGQEKSGDPFGIYDFCGKNVDQLKKAVKKECQPKLDYCAANNLAVYPPSTAVPVEEGTESLESWAAVPKDTTGENPLIVVAPQQQQQQVSLCLL